MYFVKECCIVFIHGLINTLQLTETGGGSAVRKQQSSLYAIYEIDVIRNNTNTEQNLYNISYVDVMPQSIIVVFLRSRLCRLRNSSKTALKRQYFSLTFTSIMLQNM